MNRGGHFELFELEVGGGQAFRDVGPVVVAADQEHRRRIPGRHLTLALSLVEAERECPVVAALSFELWLRKTSWVNAALMGVLQQFERSNATGYSRGTNRPVCCM